ncbi:MAG: PAS domain S-box protein [Mobilibacterium timonense]|uniref:sensor histidine kinase n=1 Tax=Mobilibacterium timonense TaxID=1871012 RepID=UPI0023578E67|nr:ATP-binding protein [Mobilibacterium timonense]MBM6990967.1 PAS domain S-box protein [Mobilibacterium timonense]
MRKRIFASIFGTSLLVIVVILTIVMGIVYAEITRVQTTELENDINLAAAGVEQRGADYFSDVSTGGNRYTLILSSGKVIYDSQVPVSQLGNHKDRQEVQEALKTGKGESVRYSTTRMEETHYVARKLDDGNVLRVAAKRITLFGLVVSSLQPIAIVLAIALLISMFLAYRLSNSIITPLQNIDLEQPAKNYAYEELAPVMDKMTQQYALINSQKRELESSQKEFNAIISNMEEGLILTGSDGRILSINPSAMRFFRTTRECLGRDITVIEQDSRIDLAILKAKENGHSILQMERGGREFQINISRVDSSKNRSGIIILVFDNTERIYAERNRREFTANVSHELKTPMHSIMGSAELIESGIAQGDDVRAFAGKIRKDANRLLGLIDDIIHLSRLDEGVPLKREPLELKAYIEEEAANFVSLAKEKDVKVNVTGDTVFLVTTRELLHEITYNLIENAIKYNVEGGSVTINTSRDNEKAVIEVADSGIGIPAEDQERVFERFYRVDKSRSKERGGTGLGLSIVKHATMDLGGEIELESAPGKGTTIRVRLPIITRKEEK